MAKKRISNNILNGMLILIIIIIVTVGVYAVAPSVLGHTSDEINVKLPNGTIEKLQQSFSQDLVVRDSTRNVSVNDIYLQSTGTYASTYLKNIRSNVQSIGECSQIEFRTENAGCTCAVGCALVISGLPRCGFCLMDITNVGDLQAIANSIGSIFVGEDVVAHVDISTTTVTYITSDGGYFTLTGTSQQLAALEAEMAGYGIHFSSALEMSSAQLQVLLANIDAYAAARAQFQGNLDAFGFGNGGAVTFGGFAPGTMGDFGSGGVPAVQVIGGQVTMAA